MNTWIKVPLFASLCSATRINGFLKESDFPSTGNDWVTLENGVEFQAAGDTSPTLEYVRKLWSPDTTTNQGKYESFYVDGSETYYDEYSQAWRLLGFYIDCGQCGDVDGDDDNINSADCYLDGNDNDQQGVCQRMLLWAAYVDLGYSGNGVGEYMYYNHEENTWVDSACTTSGSSRCVKMDCHEHDTHFSLLGYFKEPDYHSWMEQLFKHQGYCVWDEYQFEFMQSARELWPEGCSEADGDLGLYYDIKPLAQGSMTMGLYTDSKCSIEYQGNTTTVQDVVDLSQENHNGENNGNNGNSFLDNWNALFDVFKICHPCKASNMVSILSGKEGYYSQSNGEDDDENYLDDGYTCSDAAGYDDVNQCMKFKAKTDMYIATPRDLMLAIQQGSSSGITFEDKTYTTLAVTGNSNALKHIATSAVFLIASFCLIVWATFNMFSDPSTSKNMEEPFLDQTTRATRKPKKSRSTKSHHRRSKSLPSCNP